MEQKRKQLIKAIKKIGVVGAGTMGHGIALVGAKSGYSVIMHDISEISLKSGLKRIEELLTKNIEKGKMSQAEKNKTLSRIKITTDFKELKECNLIIEAIVENANLKKKLFKKLDNLCPSEVIFASNTSTIPITELASVTKRPDKFIGMHFMNPPPIIELVEVVKGARTFDETMRTIKKLAKKMGKVPIEVNDSPGFVSNRILIPMINEAIYCLMEGVATKEAIDDVMKIGMAHPMGPLELADLIGLDTCLYIMEELYRGFSNPKYKVCPLLKKMVERDYLGRKTGQGFYKYKRK